MLYCSLWHKKVSQGHLRLQGWQLKIFSLWRIRNGKKFQETPNMLFKNKNVKSNLIIARGSQLILNITSNWRLSRAWFELADWNSAMQLQHDVSTCSDDWLQLLLLFALRCQKNIIIDVSHLFQLLLGFHFDSITDIFTPRFELFNSHQMSLLTNVCHSTVLL